MKKIAVVLTVIGLIAILYPIRGWAVTQDLMLSVVAPQAPAAVATSITCSRSCTFVPGVPSTVGTLATGMNPVLPAFSGTYLLVSAGCNDAGDTTDFSISGTTVNTTAPIAGTYWICVRTDQPGAPSIYSEFTVVGVSGTTQTVPAIGMTMPLCNNALAFMPCQFSTNAANNIVFGLSTGLIPQSAGDGGPYFNDSTRTFYDQGSGGLTPNYQLVASGCPDPGDMTHFSFATRSDNLNVKVGLLVNATTPGVYHACVQVNIPGTVNTPQYQEVTLTGVNDPITSITPAAFDLSDQAAPGSMVVLECNMTVSPDCDGKTWSMPTNAHFALSSNGELTTIGALPTGVYNLPVTVSGFTQTVTVTVVPYAQAYGGHFNGGSTAGILFGWDTVAGIHPANGTTCVIGTDVPADSDCVGDYEQPRLSAQIGRDIDFSDSFTSITGATPCPNNLPGACNPPSFWNGGWMICSDGPNCYPRVVNLGAVNAGINDYQPGDYGGGAHSWGCGGVGYNSNFIDAALGDPGFIQGTINQINWSFGTNKDTTYMVRLSWEWDGDWYCHSPFHYSCQRIGVTHELTWFGGVGQGYCASPTQWAKAQIRTIQILRQLLPGVKIAIDAPIDASQQAFTDQLLPYVDLWMSDNGYWQAGSNNNPGTCGTHTCTGQDLWNNYGGQFQPRFQWMTFEAAYARATNKPSAYTEWQDAFNDGYITTNFAQWAVTNDVVLWGWWGGGSGVSSPPYGAALNPAEPGATYGNQVTQNALRAALTGGYTGTYWTKMPITHTLTPRWY